MRRGDWGKGVRSDFVDDLVVAFEVEDCENRKFRTGSFVSIGPLKPVWAERLQVKQRCGYFRKQGFTLLYPRAAIGSLAISWPADPVHFFPKSNCDQNVIHPLVKSAGAQFGQPTGLDPKLFLFVAFFLFERP